MGFLDRFLGRESFDPVESEKLVPIVGQRKYVLARTPFPGRYYLFLDLSNLQLGDQALIGVGLYNSQGKLLPYVSEELLPEVLERLPAFTIKDLYAPHGLVVQYAQTHGVSREIEYTIDRL